MIYQWKCPLKNENGLAVLQMKFQDCGSLSVNIFCNSGQAHNYGLTEAIQCLSSNASSAFYFRYLFYLPEYFLNFLCMLLEQTHGV